MRVINVIVILAAMVFAGVAPVHGQSISPDAEKIRNLREEIKKRETAEPPADLADLNRSKLIERRAELRTLLKNEMFKLQKHQTDLGTFITADETQRINDLLQTYTAEVDRLGAAMQQELTADRSAGSRLPLTTMTDSRTDPTVISGNGPSAPANSAGPKGNRTAASGSAVSNVSSTSIAMASSSSSIAPATVALALPANTEDSKETLDCEEVRAGNKAFSELDRIICGLVRDIPERRVFFNRPTNSLHLNTGPTRFALIKILIARKTTPDYLVEASEVRLDKQVGASSVNGVSPSLITHGGVPFILGFAVENGGLAQTTNNTAITFRGNPVGLFNALKNKGFMESVKRDESDPLLRFLKKTSFAFTFNTDRGPEPNVFTGSSQQLSSVSARIELINRRIPSLYIRDWENFLNNQAQRLANAINESQFIDPATQRWVDPAMQSWYEQTQAKLAATSDADVSGVLQAALDNLPIDNLKPETVLALEAIERAMGVYQSARDSVVQKINKGLVVTLDYLNKREVNAPDTSNFMFIAEKGTGGGQVNFTFNGSLTMFNNLDSLRNFVNANPTLPRPRRVRDFQFAGGIDIPFGNVREFGQFVLFANGRYERLLDNATTELGQVLPNTTGDVGQVQLGLKIPVAKTGFKIPVSITFANRTELIKERTVKGNFGFSLDLDTLFSKFNPF